jgi:hypothetical protein
MPYTSVFGGSLIFPSQLSFIAITTAVSAVLQWPTEQQITGDLVVADFINVNATAGGLTIDMPSALVAATGNKTTFNNVGANTFTVRDAAGGTIQAVAPGAQWVLVLTSNTTLAGTWLTFQMGASVSVASAGALAGAGIKAISTTLNQKIDADVEAATPFTVVDGDRARCLIYTAGAGVCNLPTPGTVGADWFFMLRNSGTGTLSVVPPSGTINSAASISMDPDDSCFIFTDGTNFFTVGLSAGSSIAFDFVSIPVAGTGDFTLSGANLNRISYRFTGLLTGNRRIVVPATTQQYWVDNQTTGAFTLTISTLAQVGPPVVVQGQTATLFCDGTNVLNANSSSSVTLPLTVGQGGTGATTVGGAQTNLQVPPVGRLINTAAPLGGGGDLSADRTLVVGAASEGASGVAEIATLVETAAGTDDARMVTPLKLSGILQGIVKATDTNRNTTITLADDPDLAGIPLQPSAQYIIEGVLVFDGQGATANGFRWALDFNGQLGNLDTLNGSLFSYQTGGTTESLVTPVASAGSQTKATFDGAAIAEVVEFKIGIITQADYVANTAVDLQWAQGTSNATNTRLNEGSWMKVTRVA